MVPVGSGVQQPGCQLDDRGEVPVLVMPAGCWPNTSLNSQSWETAPMSTAASTGQSRVGAVGPAWVVSHWLTTR